MIAFKAHAFPWIQSFKRPRYLLYGDDKKVKIKGSEVGFSLAKIQQVLILKQQLANTNNIDKQKPILDEYFRKIHSKLSGEEYINQKSQSLSQTNKTVHQIQKELNGLLHQLLKPEEIQQSIHAELQYRQKKKKKKLRITR